MKLAQLLDERDPSVYIVATRSNTWLGRTIRGFSAYRSRLDEFDHIVIVHRGMEFNMAIPQIEHRPFRLRAFNAVYRIAPKVDPFAVVAYGERAVRLKWRYATWQVITKAFTMLFGWQPIKARQDCIEFVIRAVAEGAAVAPPKDVDRLTVAQGVSHMLRRGQINPITDFTNSQTTR